MSEYNPSPIYSGLSGLGDSVKEIYGAKKENDFFTQKIEDLSKLKDPNTGEPLLDPEVVQKAYGKSLSAKKALVADTAFAHQDALDTRAYNLDKWQKADQSNLGWYGQRDFVRQPADIAAAENAGLIYLPENNRTGVYHPKKTAGSLTNQIVPGGGRLVTTPGGKEIFEPDAPLPVAPASTPVPGGGRAVTLPDGKIQYVPDAPAAAQRVPTDADVTFHTHAQGALGGLDQLAATIKKVGTWESNRWTGTAAESALLDSLPYTIAIQTAKLMDPGSVVSAKEIETAKEHLFPIGWGTNKEKALAAIENHKKLIANYIKNRGEAQQPPNAAPSVQAPALTTATNPGLLPPPEVLAQEKLTPAAAAKFRTLAGGDLMKARQLAREAGYHF